VNQESLFQSAFAKSLEAIYRPNTGSALSPNFHRGMSSLHFQRIRCLHISSTFGIGASLRLNLLKLNILKVSRAPFQHGQMTFEVPKVRFRYNLSTRQSENVGTFFDCFTSQHPFSRSPLKNVGLRYNGYWKISAGQGFTRLGISASVAADYGSVHI
jgi:hypothetical protein